MRITYAIEIYVKSYPLVFYQNIFLCFPYVSLLVAKPENSAPKNSHSRRNIGDPKLILMSECRGRIPLSDGTGHALCHPIFWPLDPLENPSFSENRIFT